MGCSSSVKQAAEPAVLHSKKRGSTSGYGVPWTAPFNHSRSRKKWCMPVEESTFNWLRDLTLADLIQLATWIPLLIRAKLCNQHLDYLEVHNSSLNEIQEEAARSWEELQSDLTPLEED
eukprot:symbB.v1.2.039710.t1/scaffold6726.1/size15933/1